MSRGTNTKWISRTVAAGVIAAAATAVLGPAAFAEGGARVDNAPKLSREDLCVGADGALRFGRNLPSDCERVKDSSGNPLFVGRPGKYWWETPEEDYTLLGPDGEVVKDGYGLTVSLRGDFGRDAEGREKIDEWWVARSSASSSPSRAYPGTTAYGHSSTPIKDDAGQLVGLQGLDLEQLKTFKIEKYEVQRHSPLLDKAEAAPSPNDVAAPTSSSPVDEPADEAPPVKANAAADQGPVEAAQAGEDQSEGAQVVEPANDQVVIVWYDTTAEQLENPEAQDVPAGDQVVIEYFYENLSATASESA